MFDVFEAIQPQMYRWRDAVAKKGDAARLHLGYIAQRIEEALIALGLDPARYAFWCRDVDEEDGSVHYALRYDQLFVLLDAVSRRRAARLEARLARLEALVAAGGAG